MAPPHLAASSAAAKSRRTTASKTETRGNGRRSMAFFLSVFEVRGPAPKMGADSEIIRPGIPI